MERCSLKITVSTFLVAFLVAPAFIFSAEVGSDRKINNKDSIVVSGIGYPPIKAQNAAQARLMARRAAIIDAYRNALVAAGSGNNDENNFYTGLSGFVKGMTIEKEEYLEDGGIRILAKVHRGRIIVSSKTTRKDLKENGQGPLRVSMDEWYKIIERSVRFE